MERSFDAVSDMFRDFLDGQIKGWEDLGNRIKKTIDSIASDYLSLILKTALLGPEFGKPGGKVGGWIGALLPSLFGGGTTVTPWEASASEGLLAMNLHRGGIVGQTRVSMRRYDPAMFAGAGRYQAGGFPGLGSDEVPAILHRGEEVIPAGERGRGGNIYNTWHVKTNDAGSFLRSQAQVEGMVARAVRRGQRKL